MRVGGCVFALCCNGKRPERNRRGTGRTGMIATTSGPRRANAEGLPRPCVGGFDVGKSTHIPDGLNDGNIYVPVARRDRLCDSRHPDLGHWCTRPGGHTGRHAFFWRFSGRLRAVWPAQGDAA